MQKFGLIFLLLPLAAGIVLAQRRGGWRGWGGGGDSGIVSTEGRVPVDVDTVRTAREIATHSTDTSRPWSRSRRAATSPLRNVSNGNRFPGGRLFC